MSAVVTRSAPELDEQQKRRLGGSGASGARHDLYACELPIGGSLSTVAVAMRQMQQRRADCPYPCNSGAPAVISRPRGALLVSCTQASVAESKRQTLAPDDRLASGVTPPSLPQLAIRERRRVDPETLAWDEDHASAEARSALKAFLLLPGSGRPQRLARDRSLCLRAAVSTPATSGAP
jgi:hypothetical protein